MLAASRSLPLAGRAAALGGATSLLAGWLLTQSRGPFVALVFSALVFFVLVPARVRALVPALLSAALVAAAYGPLTAPYRADGAADVEQAIRTAALTLLVLTAAGAVAGLVSAAVDRRVRFSRRASRVAGAVAVLAVAGGLTVAAVAFFVAVDHPRGLLEEKWEAFQTQAEAHPEEREGSSHLVNVGSGRYDFWRVALHEFSGAPVAGIGGRGFGVAYLDDARTDEQPTRSHSLVLDVLSETGIVGLALLVVGLGIPLVALARRAPHDLLATALLASCAFWLVQASADWIWTIPALGVPFFLLLGIGASRDGRDTLRQRIAVPAAIAVVALALTAIVPPWLSAKFTERAADAGDAELAQRLDPLSVEPLLAEAALASSPDERIAALREALEIEPRSFRLHVELWRAYLDAGRTAEARRAFARARALYPRGAAELKT